ncbi:hypothetical protein [Pyrobaculum islandicum]|uniref:hypothetical protein n=1 Tax=Pyrobaculum islandicum TaxID=2277 RepID=UPI000AC50C6A|nr:hypothetical protein [Pyrobaculum islandicum]
MSTKYARGIKITLSAGYIFPVAATSMDPRGNVWVKLLREKAQKIYVVEYH